MTLSRHFSLSFIASGRSSGLHPVSSHSRCMYVRAGSPALVSERGYKTFDKYKNFFLQILFKIYIYIYSPTPVRLSPLAREIMVATSVKQGSSNKLSSRLPLSGYMETKTNVIHKRLNFLRLRWFPRG